MELVPSNTQLSFEVTYDSPSLFVGMSVYNDSGLTPVLVSGPTRMTNVVGNTYRAKYTPDVGNSYVIFKAVYTDITLATIDTNYSQGSETIVCENVGTSGGSVGNADIIGFVENINPIIGLVAC